MNRVFSISAAAVLFAAAPSARAASWVPAGPVNQSNGIVPIGYFGPTTIGANVIAGNQNYAATPGTWSGGPMEMWEGSLGWEVVQPYFEVLAATTDFNGDAWGVETGAPGACPAGFGHAAWLSFETFGGWQFHQLDAAHPQCISSLAVGNVCLDSVSPVFGAAPPAGCNDSEIFGVGPGSVIYQWAPSSSSWVVATQYTGAGAISEIALSPDTGCGGAPDLWALDGGLGLWQVPSVELVFRGLAKAAPSIGIPCTRSWVSQQPPGCPADPETSQGVYSITTDYALCQNDVYRWSGSAWQAQGAGTCPSAFLQTGGLPMSWNGIDPIYPEIGASPGEPPMCWGGEPLGTYDVTGQYTYQLK